MDDREAPSERALILDGRVFRSLNALGWTSWKAAGTRHWPTRYATYVGTMQSRDRAHLESLVQAVGPAPPGVSAGTPPQHPAGPSAIVSPPGEDETAGLHGRAAGGTGRSVGHAADPSAGAASPRSNSAFSPAVSPATMEER
ncbi:8-oxoguanine DNA glycosylase OGG fold protein [Streptomyces eurythermus]